MLAPILYFQNIHKTGTGNPLNEGKPAKTRCSDPFNSILIKHQLNMLHAWIPKGNIEETGIDPLAFSKAFLKLKHIPNVIEKGLFNSPINTQRALQSYKLDSNLTDGGPLDKSSIKALAESIAVKYGIPEALFQKLIQTESAYDPKAKSSRGAMGLGQIMPITATELGLVIGDEKTPGSVWHPESNLDASARYLKKLFDKYTKEGIQVEEAWNFAAGAYNAGMGNIARAIKKISHIPVQTWDQVAKVLPQVTGKFSRETIRYVNLLRT